MTEEESKNKDKGKEVITDEVKLRKTISPYDITARKSLYAGSTERGEL